MPKPKSANSTIPCHATPAGGTLQPIVIGDTPPAGPDAELIRVCKQHIANLEACNADDDDLEPEDPRLEAYCATSDAIDAARPQTLSGMLAKARMAMVESHRTNDDEWEGAAGRWAVHVVRVLVRLADAGKSDAMPGKAVARSAINALKSVTTGLNCASASLIVVSCSDFNIDPKSLVPISDYVEQLLIEANTELRKLAGNA